MKVLAVILAAVLAGALPWITSSNYIIGIALSACIFTVAAAALNLVYGYTGMLSFAQLGFWGIGGYATALTVMTFGGNFWMGLVWAALINGAIALAIGYPALRTNRHAFVITTLAFALLASLVARDWVSLTRGPLGIPGTAAADAVRICVSHHAAILLHRVGLRVAGARLPVCAVHVAHRPHTRRDQTE